MERISHENMTSNSTSQNFADDNPINILPGWYKCCIAILMTFSILLNSFVIVQHFYFRSKFHRNIIIKRYFIFGLAWSDLFQATIGFSLQLISTSETFQVNLCQASAFAVTFFAFISINTIALVHVERYIHICLPWLKAKLMSSRTTYQNIFLASAWVYAMFWAAFPLFHWKDYNLIVHGTCTINWDTKERLHRNFIICVFVFCVFLPFSLMTVCSLLCKRTLRHMRLYARNHFGAESVAVLDNAKAEAKNMRIALIMAAASLFAWTPYSVLCLMRFFNMKLTKESMSLYGMLANVLAKTSCILNPVIYAFGMKTFRKEVKILVAELLQKAIGNEKDIKAASFVDEEGEQSA